MKRWRTVLDMKMSNVAKYRPAMQLWQSTLPSAAFALGEQLVMGNFEKIFLDRKFFLQ
ncbi:MAG: hypothetical protein LBI69_01080 [Puniceicoccales bacterium]|jgi:hypothetical protein|nr:hypothetical protein [Puniceicoccales bacterium]